jgi:hypothetical protein
MKSEISAFPQSDIELWLQFFPTIWRLCERLRAASAASHGGVTGSTSPEIIRTGTSETDRVRIIRGNFASRPFLTSRDRGPHPPISIIVAVGRLLYVSFGDEGSVLGAYY